MFLKLAANELIIEASTVEDAEKKILKFGYPKIITYHFRAVNSTELNRLIKLKDKYSLSTFIVVSDLSVKLVKSFCLSVNVDCYMQYSASSEHINPIAEQHVQISSLDLQGEESEKFCILSIRQYQILKLIEHGYSNMMISKQLNIGIGTVKQHLTKINRVLNTRSRARAVLIAKQKGLI